MHTCLHAHVCIRTHIHTELLENFHQTSQISKRVSPPPPPPKKGEENGEKGCLLSYVSCFLLCRWWLGSVTMTSRTCTRRWFPCTRLCTGGMHFQCLPSPKCLVRQTIVTDSVANPCSICRSWKGTLSQEAPRALLTGM